MAKRKKKQVKNSSESKKPVETSSDYESFLINKIDKCQRVVDGLTNNPIWNDIKEDFETSAKSLDLSWAFADATDPKFRQAQAAKMAAQSFLNLKQNYEYDLKMATKQLSDFQNPNKVVKRDFDEEGIIEPEGKKGADAYHS